jgi:hypothetical protein
VLTLPIFRRNATPWSRLESLVDRMEEQVGPRSADVSSDALKKPLRGKGGLGGHGGAGAGLTAWAGVMLKEPGHLGEG